MSNKREEHFQLDRLDEGEKNLFEKSSFNKIKSGRKRQYVKDWTRSWRRRRRRRRWWWMGYVEAQDQKKRDPSCFHLRVAVYLCKNWQRQRDDNAPFFSDFYPNNTFSSLVLWFSFIIYLRFVRWLTRRERERESEKKTRQYVRWHTLTTRERGKVERMNEATYEDDVDDDDNNNNNKNTLQFYPLLSYDRSL